MRGRIKLTDSVAGSEIEVDGQRIESGVRALTIEASAGRVPQISLELAAVELVDVEGSVSVLMTGAVRNALVTLGWTPPAEG